MKIGTNPLPQVKLKKEFISVHLPRGYKQKLQKLAFDQDRSLSSLVKRQIDILLEQHEDDKRT